MHIVTAQKKTKQNKNKYLHYFQFLVFCIISAVVLYAVSKFWVKVKVRIRIRAG